MKHKIRQEYYRLRKERTDDLKNYQQAYDNIFNKKMATLQVECESTGHEFLNQGSTMRKCIHCGSVKWEQ